MSGEAPVVDITSARTEQTISGKTVTEIPTSRLYSSLTQLVPALNVQGNDVGGSQGNVFSVFQIHGGRRNEGQVLVDGMIRKIVAFTPSELAVVDDRDAGGAER